MLVRKDVWEEVGGIDERFAVELNDIHLCMRIREAGYLVVWTPFAELYHYESKSRGQNKAAERGQNPRKGSFSEAAGAKPWRRETPIII